MREPEASGSGYLARAALESEEADQEGFQPDPGDYSLPSLKMSDRSTSLGSRPRPGVGKSHSKAVAAHLGQTERQWALG